MVVTPLFAVQLVGVPTVPLKLGCTPPKATVLEPWLDPRLVPFMVTVVPTLPDMGDTDVMLGSATIMFEQLFSTVMSFALPALASPEPPKSF
jgi:hypothetical protein